MDLVTLALAKSYTDKEIQKAEMGDIQLDTGLGKSGYAADSAAVKQYVDEATSKIPNWILLHEQSGRKVQIADYSKNPIDIEKGQSITSNYGNSMSVLASFFAQCYQICSGGLDLNYEVFAKRLAEEGQILVDNNVFIGTSHKVSVSWNENPNCYKNITIDQATYQGERAWMISDLDRDGVLGARTIFILSDGSILSNDLLSTDTTLTERGIPADAKVVGDKIKIVESNIETNINQALTEAKESGEFDGPQGETGPSAIHVGVEAPENEDITVWINPEDDDFSDFISTPPTAEVGQTIVVEEIDEKGKPTKWKAVDLPAGGSGAESREACILADFTLEEDVDGFTVHLNDDPFNYSSLLITITATRIANGENQYMGYICNGTSKAVACHLNSLFDATSQKTAVVKVDLFKTKIFTLAHKRGDYQWNTTAHYSFAYDIEPYNSGDGNVLRFENASAVAGSRLTVEGVK